MGRSKAPKNRIEQLQADLEEQYKFYALQERENSNGRAHYVPTDDDRYKVAYLCGLGLTPDAIAAMFRVPEKVFKEKHALDLEVGRGMAIWKLSESVYSRAFDSDALAQFWMKTQAGWKETQKTEISGNLATQAVDTPPQETYEQWVERKKREQSGLEPTTGPTE